VYSARNCRCNGDHGQYATRKRASPGCRSVAIAENRALAVAIAQILTVAVAVAQLLTIAFAFAIAADNNDALCVRQRRVRHQCARGGVRVIGQDWRRRGAVERAVETCRCDRRYARALSLLLLLLLLLLFGVVLFLLTCATLFQKSICGDSYSWIRVVRDGSIGYVASAFVERCGPTRKRATGKIVFSTLDAVR
jgi:hypothetical protein